MLQTPEPPRCPNCAHADAVRPITAAFSDVTASAEVAQANQGTPPLQVAAEIRRQLAAPAEQVPPQKSAFPASQYRQTSPLTESGVGRRIDTALFLGWLVLTFVAYMLVSMIDDDLAECLGTAIAFVLVLIVVGFRQKVLKNLPIAGLREYYRRDEQEDAEAEQRAQQAYQAALADYEQRRSRAVQWSDLLYCVRCNGVFAVEEKVFVPSAELQSYLAR